MTFKRQGKRAAPDHSVMGAGINLPNLTEAGLPLIIKMTMKQSAIPEAIKAVDHRGLKTRETLDQNARADAREKGFAGHGALGRHRTGRVDTGEQTIKVENDSVSSGFIALGVYESSPNLLSIFTYEREDGKWVVSLVYGEGEPSFTWTRELKEALLELAEMSWANVHGWDNTQVEKAATLNFSGPRYGQTAKRGIELVDGVLNIAD